jgi:hypothetical protein
MAIETEGNTGAPTPKAETTGSAFGGATFTSSAAPGGKLDVLAMLSNLGGNRIDAAVEPYLNEVLKNVKETLPGVELFTMPRLRNAYGFRYNTGDDVVNVFGLWFVHMSDPVSQNLTPESSRIAQFREELKIQFAGQQLRPVDIRVVIAGYEPEMSRTREMSETIVRSFQVNTNPDFKNAQLNNIIGEEFVLSWSLSEARAVESALSPHGVRPRMDIGMTLSAKIRTNAGKDFKEFDTDYRTIGVIGGYVEVRPQEIVSLNNQQQALLYQPVVNITVCNSYIPLEGIGAIMLALFAPSMYNSMFWATQWRDLSDSMPNPGMLEMDPENIGRPLILKNQDELEEFVRKFFGRAHIAIQVQDGRDNISGMQRLALPDARVKQHFMDRITQFFGTPSESAGQMTISTVLEHRFDGVYGDEKGILKDSRDIDYLYIAAKKGTASIDQDMRKVLLGGSDNPTDRAKIIRDITGTFKPLYFDTQALINPAFIQWIGQKAQAGGLVVVDPTMRTTTRSISSYTGGFGNGADVGAITSTGVGNRVFGMSSVWNIG